MDNEIKPSLEVFPLDNSPRGRPGISEIHYDVWTLRVTLDFPKLDGVVYVDFPSLNGFRVLDEGDLAEFWPAPKGWLFTVSSGGWLHLESSRGGFISDDGLSEFLIAGQDDCVNVLASETPTVTIVDCGD